MRATGGGPVVVDEVAVARAHALARPHAGIAASATGTAGLAGLLSQPAPGRSVAVLLTGVAR